MVTVIKKRGENKETMFKRFSYAFTNEEIALKVRKCQFYKRPSIVRKEEEKERRSKRNYRH